MARAAEDKARTHCLCKPPRLCSSRLVLLVFAIVLCIARTHLVAYLFLVLSGKVDKVIIFCSNQEWNGSLVEASTLSVPLFYAVQRRLSGEIEHEKDCNSVIADKWEHVDEFSLTAEIPDREGDFGVAY